MNLPFDEFVELYREGISNITADKLWLAYVNWQPDMSFKEFLIQNGIQDNSNNEVINGGVYIDQIGF